MSKPPPPLHQPSDDELAAFFAPPTDADRDHRRTELLGRARAVRREGWGPYRNVWSSGEVLAVALILGDDALLTEVGHTRDTVISRWAYDLHGIEGGRVDEAADFPATRAWFAAAQTELATEENH